MQLPEVVFLTEGREKPLPKGESVFLPRAKTNPGLLATHNKEPEDQNNQNDTYVAHGPHMTSEKNTLGVFPPHYMVSSNVWNMLGNTGDRTTQRERMERKLGTWKVWTRDAIRWIYRHPLEVDQRILRFYKFEAHLKSG